jgi:hypothetical protein
MRDIFVTLFVFPRAIYAAPILYISVESKSLDV